ncbi:MAG TPA: NrdJb, partial [Xanthomonadaceae bacterium]|nr:NrdJb [Xanthomonadaceae bacterium]
GFPPGATMCNKCNTSAVVIMDGCATCLSCGYSKCG